MINPLPVVLADMKKSIAGVIAVIVLIAIAVSLGVGISAQERALRKGSNAAADSFDVIIGAPGSQAQLLLTTVYLQPASIDLIDGKYLEVLRKTQGVKWVAPIGFGDSYEGYPVIGSTVDFITLGAERDIIEGKVFSKVYEAVIGYNVKLNIGDTFNPVHGMMYAEESEEEDYTHHGIPYEVVGRLPRLGSPYDYAIVVPIEAVWAIHSVPTGHAEHYTSSEDLDNWKIGPPWDEEYLSGVPAIVVKPIAVRDAYQIRNKYRNLDETTAIFPAEVLLEFHALVGDAQTVLSVVSIATQVLVIFAVLLAVLASMQQRQKQMGVLRALGASRGYIFLTIWSHIVFMITIGALIGLALGWLMAYIISDIVSARTGLLLPVSLTIKEAGMVFALIVIGVFLAMIPAVTACRRSVSSVLRS